jgi:hypothetical protein
MNKRVGVFIVLVILLTSFTVAAEEQSFFSTIMGFFTGDDYQTQAETEIDSCGTINASGEYYLNGNISYLSNKRECLIFEEVENVTLDCRGNTINYENIDDLADYSTTEEYFPGCSWSVQLIGPGIGIINSTNIIIKNCILEPVTEEFKPTALYLEQSTNLTFYNNTFNGSIQSGFGEDGVNYVNFTNNHIYTMNQSAVSLPATYNIHFENNYVRFTDYEGTVIKGAFNPDHYCFYFNIQMSKYAILSEPDDENSVYINNDVQMILLGNSADYLSDFMTYTEGLPLSGFEYTGKEYTAPQTTNRGSSGLTYDDYSNLFPCMGCGMVSS